MSADTEQRKLATFMSTGLVRPGELAPYDQEPALDLFREHLDLLRDTLPMFGGCELQSTGDGLRVEFPSALAAVQCALEIQRTLAERNEKKAVERHIRVRIGIHLGRVERRGKDMMGDGVQMAARIEPLAEPGGICVTRAVFEQVEGKVPEPLVQLSRAELENFPAGLEVYRFVLEPSPVELQTAEASRKQLFWLVLGVVALNLILFLKFGLNRKSEKPASTVTTDSPSPTAVTNVDQK